MATAYLVWPLAFANMIRESDADPIWSRLHARQAFVFGLLASVLFLVLLALPLITVILFPGITTGATIVIYTIGLALDAIAGVGFVLLAVRYSARTARGELFSIPLVTPIVDTVFRLRPP